MTLMQVFLATWVISAIGVYLCVAVMYHKVKKAAGGKTHKTRMERKKEPGFSQWLDRNKSALLPLLPVANTIILVVVTACWGKILDWVTAKIRDENNRGCDTL